LPDSDFEHIDADNGDYEDPLPVLGTCEALYAFEGIFITNATDLHGLLGANQFKFLVLL